MPGPAIQPAKANREPEESYKTLESPAVKRSADKNANDVHEEKPGLEEERREGASELELSFLPIVLLNHIQICFATGDFSSAHLIGADHLLGDHPSFI